MLLLALATKEGLLAIFVQPGLCLTKACFSQIIIAGMK
jgi:hypothetical protein